MNATSRRKSRKHPSPPVPTTGIFAPSEFTVAAGIELPSTDLIQPNIGYGSSNFKLFEVEILNLAFERRNIGGTMQNVLPYRSNEQIPSDEEHNWVGGGISFYTKSSVGKNHIIEVYYHVESWSDIGEYQYQSLTTTTDESIIEFKLGGYTSSTRIIGLPCLPTISTWQYYGMNYEATPTPRELPT